MKRLNISDGTQWPDPEGSGIEWKLRYAPEKLTRGEQLGAAEVLAAYCFLLRGTINPYDKIKRIRMAIIDADMKDEE